MAAETLECYLDPLSPWGFRAACWLRNARAVRSVEIRWGLLSLAELNPNLDDAARAARYAASRDCMRALVQAEREGGQEALERMFFALASARYERGADFADLQVVDDAANAAGIPGVVQRAMADASTLAWIEEEHRRLAGLGVIGIPTLIFEGAEPIFGPVLNAIPEGEDAGAYLDHVAWLARRADFAELKRNRTPWTAPTPARP